MFIGEVKHGTYTGTGAAQTITLGFKPLRVEIINVTDGDTVVIHHVGMTDGSSINISTASATVTNAVTLSATGFSVGTDNSVSENGKTFRYIATGGVDGSV